MQAVAPAVELLFQREEKEITRANKYVKMHSAKEKKKEQGKA